MSIRVKLKATGQTGTGYNLNGADDSLCDWFIELDPAEENNTESIQASIRSDKLTALFVELSGGEWVDLEDAINQDRVRIDESNGRLYYAERK